MRMHKFVQKMTPSIIKIRLQAFHKIWQRKEPYKIANFDSFLCRLILHFFPILTRSLFSMCIPILPQRRSFSFGIHIRTVQGVPFFFSSSFQPISLTALEKLDSASFLNDLRSASVSSLHTRFSGRFRAAINLSVGLERRSLTNFSASFFPMRA